MRFFKRNWKTILSAVVVLLVVAAAIAGTSIHSVKDEQKRAMEALQPVEIGEEQILTEEDAETETAEAEQPKEQTGQKGKKTEKKQKAEETAKPKKETTGETAPDEKKTEKKRNEKKSEKAVKQGKTSQTKEEIAKQKEKEAKQNTKYPKVVITVPQNEELRQNDEAKKDDDRKISDGTATDQDDFKTDPVPSGKPLPVNPDDQEVDNDEEFYVTISIDCLTILQNMENLEKGKEKYVGDGWILKTTKVKCKKGQTVYDILEQVCKAYSIQMESSYTPMYGSSYVEGIGNLYEFDCGNLSGWMYNVDGWYPNYGCSRYVLKAGEAIQWRYTCNGLGADLGSDFMSGESK
ncbi:putative uncharacterized protein [Roseburia sp. CAG:309]|nr:putative uncharacterized protein [Roseburia sp. CAG:309]